MAAGDFTASALPDILIRMADMFGGDRLRPELNQPIETIMALATRQTVNFTSVDVLLDTANCTGAKVVFLKNCDATVTDGSITPIASCDITGAETESAALTLANNLYYHVDFMVSAEDCADVFTTAEKVSLLMAQKMVSLESKINAAGIAFLVASSQDNVAPMPAGWSALDPDVIAIPIADIKPETIATLDYMAQLNNLYSPFMISGFNFYTAKTLADYASLSTPNYNALFSSPLGDIVFDLKNIDSLTGLRSTFHVDPSAYVFWPSNDFKSESPESMNDQYNTMVWRQRAPRLVYNNNGSITPVYFDVMKQLKCTTVGGRNLWNHHYRLIFRGGLQLGPAVCNAAETGILHYKAV